METTKTEQFLVENVSDVQLIDIDRLFPETREKILQGKKSEHDFNTIAIEIREQKPGLFFSHKDNMFLEIFIDQIVRIRNGGLVWWHEVELKISSGEDSDQRIGQLKLT